MPFLPDPPYEPPAEPDPEEVRMANLSENATVRLEQTMEALSAVWEAVKAHEAMIRPDLDPMTDDTRQQLHTARRALHAALNHIQNSTP